MFNDFSLYIWTLFEKYQLIFGVVIPSAIAAPCLNMIDRFKNWSGARAVTAINYALVVSAVFWIGFLAWRDEHTARMNAESKPPFDVSRLPRDIDGLKKGDVWNNSGTISIVQ